MRCPLRNVTIGDCIEIECAWWDKTCNECSILSISKSLDNLPNRKDIGVTGPM